MFKTVNKCASTKFPVKKFGGNITQIQVEVIPMVDNGYGSRDGYNTLSKYTNTIYVEIRRVRLKA